ncbi:MAG: hypothetical protein ACOYBY_05845 [Dermatophilaceae bacterium]
MATTSGHRRPRLASSPFKASPEPAIEQYVVDERVTHDSYGLGRVVGVEAGWVTVDFQTRTVRIATPFRRMTKL